MSEPGAEVRHVHDPKVLRAIAHPMRNRILTELSASGSLRAADLARELDIPANQASFHLRQLARYGLVEDDPSAARDRRDRVWRVPVGGLAVNLGDIEAAPGGRAAAQVFRRNRAAWAHHAVDVAYADERPVGTHRSISDHALKLTKAEADELAEQLAAHVTAFTERIRNDAVEPEQPDQQDPQNAQHEGRRTYLLLSLLLVHPELSSAETPGSAGKQAAT